MEEYIFDDICFKNNDDLDYYTYDIIPINNLYDDNLTILKLFIDNNGIEQECTTINHEYYDSVYLNPYIMPINNLFYFLEKNKNEQLEFIEIFNLLSDICKITNINKDYVYIQTKRIIDIELHIIETFFNVMRKWSSIQNIKSQYNTKKYNTYKRFLICNSIIYDTPCNDMLLKYTSIIQSL